MLRDVIEYGMLLFWKLGREGCRLVKLSGGPGRTIKCKVLGNLKCEEFPKYRMGRNCEKSLCKKIKDRGLRIWVERERCGCTKSIHYFWNFFFLAREHFRLGSAQGWYAKSLPHNSMSKTGSPPLGDKLPPLSNLVLNSLQAELELGLIE